MNWLNGTFDDENIVAGASSASADKTSITDNGTSHSIRQTGLLYVWVSQYVLMSNVMVGEFISLIIFLSMDYQAKHVTVKECELQHDRLVAEVALEST